MKEKISITHLGEKISSKYYIDQEEFTDEDCEQFKKDITKKPQFVAVERNFKSILKHKNRLWSILEYYVQDAMWDTLNAGAKWTVNEYLQSNDLIRVAVGTIQQYPKTFIRKSLSENFRHGVRYSLNGISTAVSVPIPPVIDIIKNYSKPGDCHIGFATGWGGEMLSSLSVGCNYFGIEPNLKSSPQLQKMGDDFIKYAKFDSTIQIKTQGSELFIPEWVDKMNLAYSIPPQPGEQSYKSGGDQSENNRNHRQWIEEYWRTTVQNVRRYLVEDGIFLLSTKNTKNHPFVSEMSMVLVEEGFEMFESQNFKHKRKIREDDKRGDKCLDIYAFRKVKG